MTTRQNASAGAPVGAARPRKSRWQKAANLLLNIAAVLGAICIIGSIIALVFGMRLVIFKSGSMDPAIPAGSLAITREVDAATLVPGDVTMVDRGDSLDAITHRVVTTVPGLNGSTIITMQGDANGSPDPDPYTVVRAGRVIWSMPELGYIFVKLLSPIVLLTATFVIALIVGMAAWPRKEETHPPPPTDDAGGTGEPPDPAGGPAGAGGGDNENVDTRV